QVQDAMRSRRSVHCDKAIAVNVQVVGQQVASKRSIFLSADVVRVGNWVVIYLVYRDRDCSGVAVFYSISSLECEFISAVVIGGWSVSYHAAIWQYYKCSVR